MNGHINRNEMNGYSPTSDCEVLVPYLSPTPVGLASLYNFCKRIYPDQCNPLQATTVIKFWLGGPEPLDYISMYNNPGDRMLGIPPHWHYISFGLSDLHGDGRVHTNSYIPNTPSGFGFEFTFRLLKEPLETSPPTWPARLMQSLSRYVFATGNTLYAGDHVSWHNGLDGRESRLKHMIMGEDPQLQVTVTPFGTVRFVQIFGVCYEELHAVQRWNGPGVLQILKRHPATGGPWLITNMHREESMFDVDPTVHDEINDGIKNEGSNLCGITAVCSWEECNDIDDKPLDIESVEDSMGKLSIANNLKEEVPENVEEEKKEEEKEENEEERESVSDLDLDLDLSLDDTNDEVVDISVLSNIQYVDKVHLTLNLEAGRFLPLVLKGRIRHGRHFTFKALDRSCCITFVASSVSGTLVSNAKPYVADQSWLQILLPNSFLDIMESSLMFLSEPVVEQLPKTINWPDRKLSITIIPDRI